MRFQAYQRSPTNKHWVRQVHWYNEGVQDVLDALVCSFQNYRHHDTPQRM